MSPLPPEALEALGRAAATRRDIARLVLVERHVEPRSEPAFTDRRLVIVLDELPAEAPPADFLHQYVGPLSAALPRELGMSYVLPSPLGLAAATGEGVVVYERGAAP